MNTEIRLTRPVAALCAALIASASVLAQQLPYPATRKIDHVDTYHGVKVPDPYRWLEDDNSPETAAWVEAQNKVTFPYLEKIPYRAQLQARVKKLNEYEKYSTPFRKGPYVFFRKNAGLQNQSVLYIQKGQDGAARSPDRSEHLVGRRDRAAGRLRAVEGCEVRGLRDLPQRLGLAGIQGDGARDEEDAGRQPRVGQGVGRGLAGRRLLLQPVSGAREGAGEGLHQREPPGLLSPRRHAAVRRRRWSIRTPRTASAFTSSRRPRTSGLRVLSIWIGGRARMATPCSFATCRRGSVSSRRSSPRSATRASASWTTSATSC